MKLGRPAPACAWLSALALCALPARADEVILKTGGRLLGEARREGGLVHVELEQGAVAFPESAVAAVIPGISPAQLRKEEQARRRAWLDGRLAAADPADAQMLYGIAAEARFLGFPESELGVVLGLTLGADPDHAGARADLGHVRYRGRWLPLERAEELERRDHAREMREAGFIFDRGEWITPAESEWRRREWAWRELVSDLERERDALSYERDLARDERDGLAALVSSIEAELANARDTIAALGSDVQRLECDVANLRGELDACETALASIPRPVCPAE